VAHGSGKSYKFPAMPPVVLLVEDSPDDVLFMSRALKKSAVTHVLKVAEDGQQALEYFLGVPPYADRTAHPIPALVLLDLKLPRVPGLEVLRWIRGRAEFAATRVVVLTSSEHPDDKKQAHALGADAFVTKPGDPTQLPQVVGEVLAHWLR
jgi:CheY-like chemotaxis protein